ncbi:prolyl oligopeptidase family serine peptidase [Sphingomonas sp. CROZ-RG-20F-R02-07]|uniref:S9 family peptidase n=1 Tax=Sphingomonas sp. CROZ-RG-20F-R02-07 TaxID=2914832 RepID=UPI001F58341A|nr:prolyl oligopeptidase family serine peptidase [Sphingomonas sp. CROZ-RG-20F-R02-07]
MLRHRWAGAMIAAMLLPLAPSVAQPTRADFSIEQVLSAPYPTSLTAAPVGERAAWTFNDRGVRNVWVADATNAIHARAITAFTQDDGNDIGDLAWSPDAGSIAFTRGQTLESDIPANVADAPEGPLGRAIWIVAAAGGEPRKLGNGHSPSFSPDGGQLIFLDKKQILAVDPRVGAAPRPLLTDLGTVGSATWSPDGRRIAFVSRRVGHSLVGLYDRTAKTITWLAPSFDLDSNPVFSPDGSHVAFVRAATDKPSPFTSHRVATTPWSIWVADASTGEGRQVWSADHGTGSVWHPTLSENSLLWTAGGQLVFPWEKTGWLLPYAVAASGGATRPLASGAFETAYLAIAPDRRRIVFASNQDDVDRLHLWTVDPVRGAPTRLASTDGVEAFPEIAADGTVFALRGTGTRQLAPVVFRRDAWLPLAPAAVPTTFPTTQLATPESVSFPAKDGQLVHGQLFLPRNASGRHPTVIFFHGGPPRQMLAGFHYMEFYSGAYGFNEYLASKGYVVLSVNYRGGIGYGLNYREANDFGAGGGSEVNDIFGALTYLRNRSDVDAKRIGVWGGSYGGLMTALALARASDQVAVGVDYAGVYDWGGLLEQYGAALSDRDAVKRARASSPIATVDRWRSPVLVVHADDDRNVAFSQSTQLVQDLRAHGVEYQTIVIPNEVHDLNRYSSWLTLFHATDDYLDKHLNAPARRSGQ